MATGVVYLPLLEGRDGPGGRRWVLWGVCLGVLLDVFPIGAVWGVRLLWGLGKRLLPC